MNKNTVVLIFSVLLLSPFLQSKQVAVFKKLLKPNRITLDQDRIYITERTKVNIYSLKDYRLINTFGKQGEGPGEFKIPLRILPLRDKLLINSQGKISLFTKSGTLIREIKSEDGGADFYPLGKGYIGRTFTIREGHRFFTVQIYDAQLKPQKVVYQEKTPVRQPGKIELFRRSFMHRTYKDRIYITGKDGFIMDCFDVNGKHLYTIRRENFKRHKIRAIDRKNADKYFRIRYGDQYEQIKNLIVYPEYFPEIRAFYLMDDKIYILPYEWNEGALRFYIYSTEGKFLGSPFIPLKMMYSMQPFPFGIINDRVYQLIENPDTEDWELHINDLKDQLKG